MVTSFAPDLILKSALFASIVISKKSPLATTEYELPRHLAQSCANGCQTSIQEEERPILGRKGGTTQVQQKSPCGNFLL